MDWEMGDMSPENLAFLSDFRPKHGIKYLLLILIN